MFCAGLHNKTYCSSGFLKEQGFSISPEMKIWQNFHSGTIKKLYSNSITLSHFGLSLILPSNIKNSAAYLTLNAMYCITHLLAHCFITVNNQTEMHQNNSLGRKKSQWTQWSICLCLNKTCSYFSVERLHGNGHSSKCPTSSCSFQQKTI